MKLHKRGFTDADVSGPSGKCFIVTGANSGVGFEVSRVLAAHGARVLLACRDKTKAEAAMAKVKQLTPGADLGFLPFDQADLASVRAAAEIAAKEPRIDVLVNNAGVMIPPLMRTKTGLRTAVRRQPPGVLRTHGAAATAACQNRRGASRRDLEHFP